MPCLVLVLVLAFPRLVMVALYLFSNYLGNAYQGILIPLIGFFVLPVTTLTYAWLINSQLPIEGLNLLLLIIAVIFDVGSWGGGAYQRRRG